jgi:HAD superfamily hydrolase (TIGR01549 family)
MLGYLHRGRLHFELKVFGHLLSRAALQQYDQFLTNRTLKMGGVGMEPAQESISASRHKKDDEVSATQQAYLFDLDGTLVDSVYQHVLAWREALEAGGIRLAVWRIHRQIGMSGGLFVNALLRETGHRVSVEEGERLQRLHAEAYLRYVSQVRPLPGAAELLNYLTQAGVPWAIATSGRMESAALSLRLVGIDSDVPIITRDMVKHAKPDPDLFLAAAKKLGVDIASSVVVGDSVWDLLAARRARALAVGLLSGGYGREELERAGAYRVYNDPADLLLHLDEVGVRSSE